jgi:hypothetical protein
LCERSPLGEIALPLVRIEKSQKSARGVHIQDLADYIDARRAEARKEREHLSGPGVFGAT